MSRPLRRLVVLLPLAAVLAAGCATTGTGAGAGAAKSAPSGGARRGPLGELHLFGVPVALNLDGRPGPDGIGVRIYGSAPGGSAGVAIKEGTLEILMYDGAIPEAALRDRPPLKVWTFDAKAIAPFAATTAIGIGYQMGLRWDAQRPKSNIVTVLARYRSTGGAELYSTPNTISVSMR